jgi:hypothetical protein
MLKKMPAVLAVCLGVFCLLCLPVVSHAQSVHGSIIGNVTDNTGAAIPNATVTVTDEQKGTVVTVQSNAEGEYEVHELIPDTYDLKVTYQGFETYQAKGVIVYADTSPKVDVQLTVGGSATTVEVNADTIPVLKTDRADVSVVLTSQDVANLPTPGRNFTNLQLLLPGAQTLGWSHAADENPQGSAQIQVDGQAFGGVAFELDGTDNQDPILGIIVINPPLDAVSETKIATQNFDAEFGKAVSSVMTAQTKSGSNAFHGSLFDYRNSNANLAKNPYSQFPAFGTTPRSAVPAGLRSQFGGSIGGPIIKDKLFFFADYQGLRQVAGVSATATIPTALLANTCLGAPTTTGVAGCDFSQYANANGTGSGNIYYQSGVDGTGKPIYKQYAGNVIPAGQLSPEFLNFIKLIKPYSDTSIAPVTGQTTGTLNNYVGNGSGPFNNNQWDERIDYTFSDKIHLFERFSRFTSSLDGPQMFGALGGPGLGYNNYGGNSKGAMDSLAMGTDIAISASLLTDFRFGYYRYNIGDTKNDQAVAGAANLGFVGLNINDPVTGGLPDFNISMLGNGGNQTIGDGLNVSRCNCPLTEREDQFQIVNNWTKIIKTHSIKVGADLRYARNLRVPSDTNRTGQLNFTGGPTSDPSAGTAGGVGFADFALGRVNNMQRYVSVSTNAKEFQKRDFFYVQDTWRATPNLTLNLGLRYEFYFPESTNGKGNAALMDLNTGYIAVAGYGGIPSNMGWNKSQFPLNPRIGVAYQFDPKTVIRSGYGRSFDIGVFGSMFGHVVTQNIPVLANQSVNAPSGPATNYAFCLGPNEPNCTQSAGQPADNIGGPSANVMPAVPADGFLPNPGYDVNTKARPHTLRMPTVDAWNLSIQHAITPTLSVTVAYVGNKSTHTLSSGDGNTTNPAESGLVLPAQYSIIGQPLHWDPSPKVVPGTAGAPYGIGGDGGTNSANFLSRYYGGKIAACQDPLYATPIGEPGIAPGMCGWTSGISYYGNNQNAHYNALQVSVAKQYTKGLTLNVNYSWQAGYDEGGGYSTWEEQPTYGRNNDIREQQVTAYGVYELPFGKKGMFFTGIPTWADEVVGGWQVSPTLSLGSGEPFSLSYSECNASIGGTSAPCFPNGRAGFLTHHLTSLDPLNHNRIYYNPVVPSGHNLCDGGSYNGFTCAGLDQIGNSGRNSNFGPGFFNMDWAIQKNFPIKESVFLQFRMDAFNAFNIVSSNNPGGNIESPGTISGYAPGANPRNLQFSFRLQF